MSSRTLDWLGRALARPTSAGWMILASALILSLSVDTGFSADDYVHAAMLGDGDTLQGLQGRAPWDIFRFTTPETTATLQQDGLFSWWADKRARLAFLRPVSAATHVLDHWLWPHSAPLQHLHNVLWAVVVFLGVWALYRQLLDPGLLLGLSLFLYVLDDSRAWFSSWVAGRNTVVATALSVWALAHYIHGRRSGSRGRYAASLVLFPVALLAGEGSVTIGAYMLAYALFMDRKGPRSGLVSLLPFGAVVVVWRLIYKKLGYGAAHSFLYTDPGAEPLLFAARFAERGPVLWLSQLGGPWSDNWSSFFVFPSFRIALYIWALLALGLAGYMLRIHLRTDARMRFFCVGAVLSTLPATAAFPADRLLNWISIGAAPMLACLLISCLNVRVDGSPRPPMVRLLGGYLVFVHVLLGPAVMMSRARGNVALRDVLERCDGSVPKDASVRDKEVIYINPPAVPLAAYTPVMRGVRGQPRPKRQMVLTVATTPVHLKRTGLRTLEVSSALSPFWNPGSQLVIGPSTRFSPGDVRQIGTTRVHVLEVDDRGAPLRFEFNFEHPLNSPRYIFLSWNETRYAPAVLPDIGQTVTLPAADYLQVLLGEKVAIEAVYPSAS